MKKILNLINNLDQRAVLTVNLLLTVLLFIPLTIWLLKTPTKTMIKATIPQPTSILLKPTATPTPVPITPSGLPEITQVDYFYGKINDSVIILGKNFGTTQEPIYFNNAKAEIVKFWHDNKIHVLVPKKTTSGKIRLKNAVSPYNFIIYDKETTCELKLEKSSLEKTISLINCPLFDKADIVLKTNQLVSPEVIVNESIPKENVNITKKTQNNSQLIRIEITSPKSFIPQELFKLSLADYEKVLILSADLWSNDQLLSLFVDPLNISN